MKQILAGISLYLDAVAGAPFTTDGSGNSVFYPKGFFGVGRVITSENLCRRITTFIKWNYVVTTSAPLIAWLLFDVGGAVLAVLVSFASYQTVVRALIRGAPRSKEKFKPRKTLFDSANSSDRVTMIVFATVPLLLCVLYLLMARAIIGL